MGMLASHGTLLRDSLWEQKRAGTPVSLLDSHAGLCVQNKVGLEIESLGPLQCFPHLPHCPALSATVASFSLASRDLLCPL